MSEITFSYKEAILHGWAMTKKYMKTLFILALVYLSFNLASGVMESMAGRSHMPRHDLKALFKDEAQGNRFYQYLQEAGYINKFGVVQDKLQQIESPADLTLLEEFSSQQEDIYEFLQPYHYRLPFPKSVFYGLSFFLWAINTVMSIGFIKSSLMLARDEEPSVSELFTNWRIVIPYLLASICYGFAVFAGFILLIIPGIIFMLMFQLYPYLVIDQGMGPIESLKHSRAITKGSRIRLAVFGLLLVLLNIGGLLCLVVGLFFTVSISSIAMAYVYDQLENPPDASLLDQPIN